MFGFNNKRKQLKICKICTFYSNKLCYLSRSIDMGNIRMSVNNNDTCENFINKHIHIKT